MPKEYLPKDIINIIYSYCTPYLYYKKYVLKELMDICRIYPAYRTKTFIEGYRKVLHHSYNVGVDILCSGDAYYLRNHLDGYLYVCVCGSIIKTRKYINDHFNTRKHIDFIKLNYL